VATRKNRETYRSGPCWGFTGEGGKNKNRPVSEMSKNDDVLVLFGKQGSLGKWPKGIGGKSTDPV